MFRRQDTLLVLCAGAIASLGSVALAQSFPSKPVRMIAPDAGGGNDLIARLLAQGLAASLGQAVIVDNRGAAGGMVAAELLTRAAPDGHTLLFYSSGLWTSPLLEGKTSYDVTRDFAPITSAASTPNVLVVHSSLQVNSVKDLIALAKSKPGMLNYGSGSLGSSNHVAAELFNSMAGVRIERVPYKGTPQALNAVVGGEVQLMFPNVGAALPHVKAGRLKALAVATPRPSALAPGLPTVASVLPGYEASAITGVFAPRQTPPALINRLNQEFVRLLERADIKDKLLSSGVEPVPSSPQQFATTIRAEVARLTKLIKETGIRAE